MPRPAPRWTAAAALLAAGGAGLCEAGAWTPERGSLYARYAVEMFTSTEDFDAEGDSRARADGSRFTDRAGSWYVEYGLRDRLAFVGGFAYKRVATDLDGATRANTGLGDAELALRYNFLRGRAVMSAQLAAKLPYAYERNDGIALGNGQEDYEVRILLGKGGRGAYVGVEGGYRFRTESPADQIRYLVEVGVNAGRRWSFRTKLSGDESRGEPASVSRRLENPMLSEDYDLGRWEATASLHVSDRWSAELTRVAFPYGRGIGAGESWQIAVALRP
jgi:hypothetical protein